MYSWYPPKCIMISPRCTEHPPMYSWYPPDVLMVSLRCTEHPPMYWTPPDVLMVSLRCTEHPLMYSWYPPDVLMVSPRCTHGIPPMYWTSPDVLNIPRCTEHTYRVSMLTKQNCLAYWVPTKDTFRYKVQFSFACAVYFYYFSFTKSLLCDSGLSLGEANTCIQVTVLTESAWFTLLQQIITHMTECFCLWRGNCYSPRQLRCDQPFKTTYRKTPKYPPHTK